MKLIIDIPETVVTAIQNGEDYRYDIHTAIAQGIPYEERPQGDLISREALKIEIEKQIAYCDDKSKHQSDMKELLRYSNTSYGLRLAHNYVDNTPTISPDMAQVLAYESGKASAERPTGKWKLIKDKSKNINAECPFCKFAIKGIAYNYEIWEIKQLIKNGDFDFEFPNYCEHCGADMRDTSGEKL